MADAGDIDGVEAGFAKLQGVDFEYFMQTYSIILGRNSSNSTVDVDLTSLGGGMNISRHHARIFYDFDRRRFALEVLGRNGCIVEGVLHLPGDPPVKLDSQDLLQIGDTKFYFLLPSKNILASRSSAVRRASYTPTPPRALMSPAPARLPSGSRRARVADYAAAAAAAAVEEEDDDHEEGYGYGRGKGGGVSGALEKESDSRSRIGPNPNNHELMQLEEEDVVLSVATVLSNLSGLGDWMPMEKLHAELLEQYGDIWDHIRVRRYLTSEEWPTLESKPWYNLLVLLRKYTEHFVINTRSKGRVTSEFVSLLP